MMSKAKVTVWADGYGRWHAETKSSRLALHHCIEAIVDAILERSPADTARPSIVRYVNDGIVSGTPSSPELIHLIEYAV